jgi:hypothetical protein
MKRKLPQANSRSGARRANALREAFRAGNRPFRRGEKVTIYSLNRRLPMRVEGVATVIGRAPHPLAFYVRFESEKVIRVRIVLPRPYQRKPQSVTKAQLACWRAISRSLLVAEFFPGWR